MEAVAKINGELKEIRRELELSVFGAEKPAPKAFDPLTDTLPAEIDAEFDKAIAAAKAGDEAALLAACHRIEAHFGFPAPNELVKNAEIPGGMYSNICLLYTSCVGVEGQRHVDGNVQTLFVLSLIHI